MSEQHVISGLRAEIKQFKVQYEKLQAELEKHRWIPVSERLPDQDTQVIVATKNEPFVGVYCSLRKEFVGNLGGVVYNNVTHWKPIILPALKGKDTGKAGAK